MQHVMVYFNCRSRVVRQLDEAMAIRLAPFALAFLGTVVRNREDGTRAGHVDSVIRFHASNGRNEDEGGWGFRSRCGLNAPIACYTCARFEPWFDAPHDVVLSELLKDRRRRQAKGLSEKLVQIHDATILAVADVVRRCGSSDEGEARGERE